MILKGSTIASTGHARQMAAHVFKNENEHILVREVLGLSTERKGFERDLIQMQMLTKMTAGKRGIFHVAISPREHETLTPEQKERALQILEEKFSLDGQSRMQIEHVKDGRAHIHVFWSTVDQDNLKLIDLPHYKRGLQDCAVQMTKEFGHEPTPRRVGEYTFEMSDAERMTERRTGRKAMLNKHEVTALWEASDSGKAFVAALNEQGYMVAKGDKCRFVLIDPSGGVSNLVRQLPKAIKTKDVAERLEGLKRSLPDVAEARKLHKLQGHLQAQFNQTPKGQAVTDYTSNDTPGQTPSLRYEGMKPTEALRRGLSHFLERQSTVQDWRLIHYVAQNSNLDKDDLAQALKSMRGIIRGQRGESTYLTTPKAVRTERSLVAKTRKGIGTKLAMHPDYEPRRDYLNTGQKRAIAHVLQSKDQVILVSGGAGVGKTSLMQEVREGLQEKNITLHAVAPSANASRGVLQDKGFEGADTIASLLQSQTKQDAIKDGVLLVDEAGMVGNSTMDRLLDVAQAQNARLILSGDWKQHNSPEAGDALRIIEQRSGAHVGRVEEIVRQNPQAYRDAVHDLSQGKVKEGVAKLDKMDSIREIVDDEKRNETIARDYISSKTNGRNVLVIAPTHHEGSAVNDVIRTQMKTRGLLGEKDYTFTTHKPLSLTLDQRQSPSSYQSGMAIQVHGNLENFERGGIYLVEGVKENGRVIVKGSDNGFRELPINSPDKYQVFQRQKTDVAKGEQLRITGNGQTQEGTPLYNGQVCHVCGFDDVGNIQLEGGGTLPKDYRNFTHGYTSTSHASQGMSAQDVIIAQSSSSFIASNDKQFYVSVSRGEERVRIYTDDKDGLCEAVERSGNRMMAVEALEQNPTIAFNKKAAKKSEGGRAQVQKLQTRPVETSPKKKPGVSWKDVKSRLQQEFTDASAEPLPENGISDKEHEGTPAHDQIKPDDGQDHNTLDFDR